MQKALEFIVGTGVIGAIVYVLLGLAMPAMQTITAAASAMLMTLLGVPATAENSLINFARTSAQIIPLCVGDIEIAILVAAIAMTRDRALQDRITGIVFASLFVMAWNPVRIALTLNSFVWFGWPAVEFVHDVLFRSTLVIVLVGFYAVWYSWERIKKTIARKKQ